MIIDFYNGAGGGSGSGYTLPIASDTTLGGIKVGSGLSIDGSTGVLSVSGGSQSGPTVIDFDAMTQQERAALHDELIAIDDAGSGNTINENYLFYRTIGGYGNEWKGARIQYYRNYFGRCVFGVVLTETDAQGHVPAAVYEANMWLGGSGNWENTNTYKISNYTLPTASDTTLGGIKVGSGLTIDSGGTLSVSGGGSAVQSDSIATIWSGSQADYDLISPKDPNTFYIIL